MLCVRNYNERAQNETKKREERKKTKTEGKTLKRAHKQTETKLY